MTKALFIAFALALVGCSDDIRKRPVFLDGGFTDSDSGPSTDGGVRDGGVRDGGVDSDAGEQCGNGVVEGEEACEGRPTQTCEDFGFNGGELLCNNCQLDTSECVRASCGDSNIDANEVCDDGAANGTYGFCNANCSGPGPRCGDQIRNGPEECDGLDLDSNSCLALGFDGGTLTCDDQCALVTDGCTECGNGTTEAGETCDDGLSNGTYGFCASDCSGPGPRCGDGVRNGPEDCDGSDLGGETCASLGRGTGTLSCSACAFATTTCTGPQILPSVGEVVITEIMQNPSIQSDNDGEWFEVYNASGRTIDLDNCVVVSTTASGSESFTIFGIAPMTPGEYHVFARSPSFAGTADYVYNGAINLNNSTDEVALECNDPSTALMVTIDVVAYDDGITFPDPTGQSMNLSSTALNSTSNDRGFNWCLGTAFFGAGDLGTPGSANRVCP